MTIGAWLRMTSAGDTYRFPDSSQSYNAHIDKIGIVYPINGGELQDDASWLQISGAVNRPFPQSLHALAQSHGQLYIPSVKNRSVAFLQTVLDSPSLQQTAADNLVTLATTRFDAPWDGVMLDFEGLSTGYTTKLSDFYTLLASELHAANLLMYVWAQGKTDDGNSAQDLEVIGSVADVFSHGIYGYSSAWPKPYSLGPNWWARECQDYALTKGISASKIRLCVAQYCLYRVAGGPTYGNELTHRQARELSGCPCMITNHPNGNIYEKLATSSSGGYCWIHDADTFVYELNILNDYGLGGIDMFSIGSEDEAFWRLI